MIKVYALGVGGKTPPPGVGDSEATSLPEASGPAPTFSVEVIARDEETDYQPGARTLKIVLTDSRPAAVERLVLNGRTGEQGCEFTRQRIVKACLDEVARHSSPEAITAALEVMRKKQPQITAAQEQQIKEESAEEFEEGKRACINNPGSGSYPYPDSADWPQTLKTGDSMQFDAGHCGDQVVNVTIFTDRGESAYQVR